MAHAILITGAGTRVGKVLAKGLAKDGHSIAVHYNRSKVGAEALVNEITQSGGHAAAIGANLFVPQDVNTLVKRSTEALGTPITGLINNASTFAYDTALDMSRAILGSKYTSQCNRSWSFSGVHPSGRSCFPGRGKSDTLTARFSARDTLTSGALFSERRGCYRSIDCCGRWAALDVANT